MDRMAQRPSPSGISRRTLLLAAAAGLAPLGVHAGGVCTPRDLARRYRLRIDRRLEVPENDACIYGGLAENEFAGFRQGVIGPQYVLVVDSCPWVQAAFLFWRLLPGRYELVGASPASTGDAEQAGCVPTPQGVFPQACSAADRHLLASRVYDFGTHRARKPSGGFASLRLQARAALGSSRARLGRPQSDGCVLLPASLVAFLDEYGVLDDARGGGLTPAGDVLPFPGRYMVVVDSERDDRPEWA